MKHYLIIGNGAAGTSAAEAIRKLDSGSEITIITDEEFPYYYRIRLNEFLAGEVDQKQLLAKKPQWYADQRIRLLTGVQAVDADPDRKTISTAVGESLPYDRLLIATGSRSFVPPIAGSDMPGVFTLRDLRDAGRILAYAKSIDRVILIGGGLLGLETGYALLKLGKQVQVVEFFPRLLPRQLDQAGAARLQAIMQNMGFSFTLGATTTAIMGNNAVSGVTLHNNESLAAGMVILAAGVRPNLDLAAPLGLACDKGIKVNSHLETSLTDVYAAGDVAQYMDTPPYGIWPAAIQQGRVAGTVMAGGPARYDGTTIANILKVAGIDLAAAGNIDFDQQDEKRVVSTETVYRKLVLRDNRLIGCILLGDISGFAKLTKAIADRTELHDLDPALLAGTQSTCN